MEQDIIVIGAGLAGCEAAWQIARRGSPVTLFEMKPHRFSAAHRSPLLAELVCSNSLKSAHLDTAPGLLKEEMRRLDSLIMEAADSNWVPAGSALAVDRHEFSRHITESVDESSEIRLVRQEITSIPAEAVIIVATGPLTSDALVNAIMELTISRNLYFYDAISPIVTSESIDFVKAFKASRYGKGSDDYVNCPLTTSEYYGLVNAIRGGEKVPLRDFEDTMPFEGCLPVEDLVARGDDTLAFGPMKPVGLVNPHTGEQPFAVVQLRQENKEATLYNMVGFQTKLKYPEQQRIFRMIPGLGNAEFVRYGSLHRNTFIHGPRLLQNTLQLKANPRILFAGQITGVEGYVESAAMGLLAGINALRYQKGLAGICPPKTTAIGALVGHITNAGVRDYQPMNVNFGLFPPPKHRGKRRERRTLMAQRALRDLETWKASIEPAVAQRATP
jgi:methylenetetrahydrofolate--tRNA-(uracil-5-)-methyltransferase